MMPLSAPSWTKKVPITEVDDAHRADHQRQHQQRVAHAAAAKKIAASSIVATIVTA